MPIQKVVPTVSRPAGAAGSGVQGTPRVNAAELAQQPLNLPADLRMLLVGDTGSGKTTQEGELIEAQCLETGQQAVLFRADKGGNLPILPLIKAGLLVEVVYDEEIPPWIWISHAIRGEAWDGKKWFKITKDKCLATYEGLSAFSDLLMMDLARLGAEKPNQAVGGESAWNVEAKFGDEVLKVAGSTISHYGLVQLRIMHEIWRTSPGVPSLWTAILARSTDSTGAGGILGAQTAGNKQAGQVARWFDYTFRINAQPVENGPAKHVLYLDTHLDKQARGVKVIANARMPLAGADVAPVDLIIEPADLVFALRMLSRRQEVATSEKAAKFAEAQKRRKQ